MTEYRDGLAYSVTSASGKMVSLAKENGLLINPNESAAFHEVQAQKLWNETVLEGWNDFSAPATLTVQSEYSVASDGVSSDKLLSRSYAEGAVELYEAGRIQMILGRGGERLVSYSYDGEGNPTRIEMEGSRRRLESQVLKLEAEVALERQKAMAEVASREAVLVQLTEQEYQARRARLLEIRSQIEAQQNYIASISLKGKAAKSALADAAGQIQVGINQVNQALETLAEQRIAQMNNISAQAQAAFQSVKTQAEEALGDIASERTVIEQSILRQELSPVIYHWYRKVMGRDPSKAEYDNEIAKVNYASGTLDITALKNQLLASPEYTARSLEVQQIKDRVTSKLRKVVSGTAAERAAELAALGLSESEVVALTSAESEQILTWLNAQSLHFGQSAFIAFEALQRDAGYSVSRLSLAASLILIDILTGTITPKESGDLVISLYAMRRLAEKRGLANQKSYAVNYEALKAMCAGDCPSRVIAHINGNHFVLITKVTDTEITYTDPGAGAENALEVVTVSKEEFLLTWLDPRNPDAGVGYIMSLITPPATQGQSPLGTVPLVRELTSTEEMSVRGAFFPFIAIAIAAVIKAVVAVVVATISAISTLITTLAAGIGNILSGLGSIAQGLFSGNFMAGLTSGFQAISSGMSQIFGSVFQAMGQFGKVFVSTFKAGGFTSIVHGTASGAGNFLSGFMASSAFKGFLATTGIGFGLQGTGQLLSEMGVSPKITNALVSGGKIAVGVGLLATGNPMGLALVTGGASEFLSRHTNLSPTVSTLISLGAASVAGFAGGLIDTGSIAGSLASLKDITIPYLSKELAVSGFTAIGSSLGLNPAVTSLISVPLRAAVGSIINNTLGNGGMVVGYRDDGTSITVSNPRDLGDFISDAIENTPAVVSFNVASGGSDSGFRAIDLDGSIVNQPGIFTKIFGSLKDAAVSAINFQGPLAFAATPLLIDNFNQKQMDDGLAQTLSQNSSVIFDRPTLENIYNTQGGITALLAQGTSPITLPDGTTANGYQFSNTTTLLFDDQSNFLGQIRNGRYELGEFSITESREFVLKNGVVVEDLGDGHKLRIEVADSKITDVVIEDTSNTPLVHIEGKDGSVFIEGPDQEIRFGNNFQMSFGPVELGFELGKLTQVNVHTAQATPASEQGTGDTLFALTNGLLNTELFSSPGYLLNLMNDVVTQSNGSVGSEDIILAPTFFSSGLLEAWNAVGTIRNLVKVSGFGIAIDAIFGQVIESLTNLVKDSVLWIADMFDPATVGAATINILTALENFFRINQDERDRDLVGVGYSGGFLTLSEVLVNNVYNEQANTGYNAISLVGLGGANIQLEGPYRKVLDKIVEIGEILLKGSVKTAEFLSNIRIELNALAALAAGPAGAASLSQTEADQVYQALVEGTVESAYDLFIAIAQEKTQLWNGFVPSLAATSNIGVVVNVYGTQDILTKLSVGGQTIGGYRNSLGVYSVASKTKALVNVEIVGASHFDYIRPEETNQWWQSGLLGSVASAVDWFITTEDEIWNKAVSDFVARLINSSQSADDVDAFLRSLGPTIANFDLAQKKWVITLPGSETRD